MELVEIVEQRGINLLSPKSQFLLLSLHLLPYDVIRIVSHDDVLELKIVHLLDIWTKVLVESLLNS